MKKQMGRIFSELLDDRQLEFDVSVVFYDCSLVDVYSEDCRKGRTQSLVSPEIAEWAAKTRSN